MKLTLTLISLFATLATVAAINIRGFTSYGCWGQQWVCYNIPAGACCAFRSNIRSMRWSLPAHTRGIGSVGKYCTTNFPAVYGPRVNSCFNYIGPAVRSARWQNGTCIWQYKRSTILERQDDTCAIEEGCVEPGVLIYSDGKVNRTISIEGKGETAAALLERGDYASLASFPDFKDELDLTASVDTYDVEPEDGTE